MGLTHKTAHDVGTQMQEGFIPETPLPDLPHEGMKLGDTMKLLAQWGCTSKRTKAGQGDFHVRHPVDSDWRVTFSAHYADGTPRSVVTAMRRLRDKVLEHHGIGASVARPEPSNNGQSLKGGLDETTAAAAAPAAPKEVAPKEVARVVEEKGPRKPDLVTLIEELEQQIDELHREAEMDYYTLCFGETGKLYADRPDDWSCAALERLKPLERLVERVREAQATIDREWDKMARFAEKLARRAEEELQDERTEQGDDADESGYADSPQALFWRAWRQRKKQLRDEWMGYDRSFTSFHEAVEGLAERYGYPERLTRAIMELTLCDEFERELLEYVRPGNVKKSLGNKSWAWVLRAVTRVQRKHPTITMTKKG